MKHSIPVLILLLIFLGACTSEGHKIKPVVSDLTESVYSSVTTQPDSMYEVFSSVNGVLDQLMVTEGQLVSKGTVLAQIQNNNPKLNAANTQIALEQAKRNAHPNSTILAAILDEIETTRLKSKNDLLNYQRQQSLWKKGIGSKAQLEAKLLVSETSKTQVKMLQDKYQRTQSDLKTALDQATLLYQSAASSNHNFTLRSTINGMVYSLHKKQGELVTPQIALATIGNSQEFKVEMLIDEVDIARVKEEQKVIFSLDAYPNEIFEGKVSKIYPSKDLRTQTFKVEALFVKQPQTLYPGLTGEANIIVASKPNVLTIPNEYISSSNQVKTEEGMVDISLGLKNMNRTEVLSGIDSSTFIYPLSE